MDLIVFLAIGGVSGWLAELLRQGKGFGIVGNVIVGILGAVFGGYLFQILKLKAGGLPAQIVMSVVGALTLLFLIDLVTGKKK